MTHSQDTIARIEDLLKMAGAPENVIEEMTDHYLSEIETQVLDGANLQNAMRDTYQLIASTDLTPLKEPKSKKKLIFGLLFIFALLLSYHFLHNKHQDDDRKIAINQNEEVAPDGWPVDSKEKNISSKYGLRFHPISKMKRFHKGIDIKAGYGTNVLASGDAIVSKIGYSKNSGNFIILEHNCKYSSKYTHLAEVLVEENSSITKGESIAKVGSTGLSSSPHLHYEILDNEMAIDPLDIMRP